MSSAAALARSGEPGRQQSARLQQTAKLMLAHTQHAAPARASSASTMSVSHVAPAAVSASPPPPRSAGARVGHGVPLQAHPSAPALHSQRLAATQPVPIDLKQSVFMSAGELGYMHRLASLDDSSLHESTARRLALKARSQARYQHWPNTLEAQREKKKLDRLRKLEAAEAEQQAIDDEEAAYQEAQRRVVLERANRLLWRDTDRVKALQGGLLYASVIKEREAQIELKKAKSAQARAVDEQWHAAAEADRLRALDAERAEMLRRAEQSRAAASQQLAQLHEVRMRQVSERADEVAEGERIKRVAQEAMREAAEEEARRQEKMAAYNAEYVRANDEQLAIKAARAAVEAQEDAKIAAFAAEKDRLTTLRREHEAAKFAAKQARFETMLRRQYDHLQQLRASEAARTEAQMRELEQKSEARIAADEAKAAALKEQTRVSRAAQIERKRAEEQRQRERDEAMTAEWRARNREMEAAELEEARLARESADRLAATLREQMIEREERVRDDVRREVEEAALMRDARQREDHVFDAYARAQVDELQRRGKTTVPLQLVLHGEKMREKRPGNYPMPNFR